MSCDVCGSKNTVDKQFDIHTIRVCRDCHSGIDICGRLCGGNDKLGIKELFDN